MKKEDKFLNLLKDIYKKYTVNIISNVDPFKTKYKISATLKSVQNCAGCPNQHNKAKMNEIIEYKYKRHKDWNGKSRPL